MHKHLKSFVEYSYRPRFSLVDALAIMTFAKLTWVIGYFGEEWGWWMLGAWFGAMIITFWVIRYVELYFKHVVTTAEVFNAALRIVYDGASERTVNRVNELLDDQDEDFVFVLETKEKDPANG